MINEQIQDPGKKSLPKEEEAAANLVCIAMNLRRAKNTELKAKANRIRLEELLASLVPIKEIGQSTTVLTNGMKVVVKCGYNYKANCDSIQQLFMEMGQLEFTPPIKVKTTRELDIKGYEWYRGNHPDIFKLITEHVTVTPKKVSVSVGEPGVVVE